MEKKIVVGIGEILWDLLPEGKQLGGAPANFAWHAQQLGARGAAVSAVGNDKEGDEILKIIQERNLTNGISRVDKPTGTVDVKLVDGVPDYLINENVAWDFIVLNDAAKEAIVSADAICFGSLAQRSEVSSKTIQHALEMAPEKCIKVFDINLRQSFYSRQIIESSLEHATVFKINDEELDELRKLFNMSGDDVSVCRQFLEEYNLRLVALTKGSNGSALITREEMSEMETPKVEVSDTIGAGDSFTAALTIGLLANKSLKEIHRSAIEISAFVCTRAGAMPVIPEELVSGIGK
ncbi:fructokinase [Marinilabilia salmonicolor]|jgi:fructokinase|uniref:carbohydrate kinase family protein n=1 Tax=Marinilabilia salmonicolor TaxID=989 RepID=UPI000D049DF9|nr:carbohydrate kinase [Marinilabilia salmonicolor]PRY97766.1 fructokinase [Marinilabilia salmonicolor]